MARTDKKATGKNTRTEVAKKAGVLYGAKKALGTVSKVAIFAGVGAAVVKVLRRDET